MPSHIQRQKADDRKRLKHQRLESANSMAEGKKSVGYLKNQQDLLDFDFHATPTPLPLVVPNRKTVHPDGAFVDYHCKHVTRRLTKPKTRWSEKTHVLSHGTYKVMLCGQCLGKHNDGFSIVPPGLFFRTAKAGQ